MSRKIPRSALNFFLFLFLIGNVGLLASGQEKPLTAAAQSVVASSSVAQSTKGRIQGTVLNESAQPVFKAKIMFLPSDGEPHASGIRSVESGDGGHFTMEDLPWGTYRIFAMKEEEDYPNTFFSSYSENHSLTATVTPQAPLAKVSMTLGPKAGALRVLSLTDVKSGKNLTSVAGITLRRVDNPHFFIGTNAGVERILVPSRTDVTVEIEADGYAIWPQPNEAKLGQIRLEPEQLIELRLELQPLTAIAMNPQASQVVRTISGEEADRQYRRDQEIGDLYRRAAASRFVVVGKVAKLNLVGDRAWKRPTMDEGLGGYLYSIAIEKTICRQADLIWHTNNAPPPAEAGPMLYLFAPYEPLVSGGERLQSGQRYLLFLDLPDQQQQKKWTDSFYLDPLKVYLRAEEQARGVVLLPPQDPDHPEAKPPKYWTK